MSRSVMSKKAYVRPWHCAIKAIRAGGTRRRVFTEEYPPEEPGPELLPGDSGWTKTPSRAQGEAMAGAPAEPAGT